MKFIRRSVAVLALLALSFWLWTILFPSPEKIIRRQLAGVAAAASFADNEGLVKQAARISELIGYFSVDAQITFDAPAHGQFILSGRSEIQELAVAARKAVRSLAVEFLDVDVTLAADKQSATVDLTATAKVPSERNHYVQEMKFVLMKINGKWLIVRAETVKTLSRMQITAAAGGTVAFIPLLGGLGVGSHERRGGCSSRSFRQDPGSAHPAGWPLHTLRGIGALDQNWEVVGIPGELAAAEFQFLVQRVQHHVGHICRIPSHSGWKLARGATRIWNNNCG